MLLTLRDELLLVALERLDVAGATLLTDELLFCCETLRVELEVLPLLTLRLELEPATLRLELEPSTLRLELEPATLRLELEPATLRLVLLLLTLRLELEPATLRFVEEPDTLRLSVEALVTDLEDKVEAGVTVRLALVPNEAVRLVLPLRFLSHPPPFILRLGLNSSTLE